MRLLRCPSAPFLTAVLVHTASHAVQCSPLNSPPILLLHNTCRRNPWFCRTVRVRERKNRRRSCVLRYPNGPRLTHVASLVCINFLHCRFQLSSPSIPAPPALPFFIMRLWPVAMFSLIAVWHFSLLSFPQRLMPIRDHPVYGCPAGLLLVCCCSSSPIGEGDRIVPLRSASLCALVSVPDSPPLPSTDEICACGIADFGESESAC